MRFLVIVGLLLIVVGILSLGFQGFAYFTHDQVAQFGPLRIMQEREHTVWLSPIIGVTALVVGGLLVLLGRNHSPADM